MHGRRRLLLLAVIIVAVAIGAVGITIVSLFEAGVAEKREFLVTHLDDLTLGVHTDRHAATLVRTPAGWQVSLGDLPAELIQAMPVSARVPKPTRPAPAATDNVIWLDTPQQLAAVRFVADDKAIVAWIPLADMRAPFQRAALHATAGLVLLLAIGLALFYRTTAPLLHSIETSEARYRTLFANTAEGVLLIGDDIEECNDRFCELFGCRRDDVLGMPWRGFFSKHAVPARDGLVTFEKHVQKALIGGAPFTWEFRTTGGATLMLDVALRRLRNEGARRVLVSLRDVTAREISTRMLRETEQALRESREKLTQAGRSSALIELAAGIAHEINQPLAAIANYARAGRRIVVSGKAGEEELVRTLDRIAEQAQRAGSAIHRIRSLVSPDSPESLPGNHPVCINHLIHEVVELMGEEIARHGARVVVSPGEGATVIAEPLQIQQVIMQLLRNALEAADAVPPVDRMVHVQTRRDGQFVEVEVEDRGPGLAPDDRARMFEPFYSTKERGMGMGLPISMSIIRSHRGELAVDEACERGTRFRFRLPADLSAQERMAGGRQATA